MTLKLAVRITGDSSGLRPAAEDARRQLDGIGVAATQLASKVDRAAAGLQRHEWVNLSRQMQDVVTMGAMGASPGQIISSQGAQIFDIFTSAQAGPAAALRAVAPFAAAIGGLAVTFGAAGKAAYDYAQSQGEVEKSLRGIGRLSGGSVEGINRIASETADSAKLSIASARSIGATFASVGRVGQEQFGDLTVVAARMGRTLGTDASDGADRLAQAFSGDVLKGAEDLNKTFGFLSGRTAELIEKQVAMGDRAGAIRTATDALKTSLLGVTEGTNGWALAWDKVSRAAKDAYDASGRAIMSIVAPTPAQTLASRQDDLAQAQQALDWVRNPMSRIDPDHLRYMRERNYSDAQVIAEGAPSAPGADTMRQIAEAEKKVEDLKKDVEDAKEKVHRTTINARVDQRNAEIADITLQAKGIVEQLTPTTADLLQLTRWQTTLEKALGTGQAPSGTAEALERVKKLLAEGGREASRLREAADDAFKVAGLLPYQRALEEIELRYRRLIKEAGTNKEAIAGLEKARDVEKSTVRIQNSDNVLRDQRLRIGEQVASLRVQSQSLFMSAEAAATLAAKQELVNEAIRNGQTPAERYGGQLEALAAQMGRVKAQEEEFQRVRSNIIGGMDDLRSGATGLMTGPFGALLRGQSPGQAALGSLQSTLDRLFERVVAKPLTDQLLGLAGKEGGGLFGDLIGKSGLFGSLQTTTTASMSVTAAVVNIAGAGVGNLLSGGVPGATGGTSGAGALPISVNPGGGSLAEPFRDPSIAGRDPEVDRAIASILASPSTAKPWFSSYDDALSKGWKDVADPSAAALKADYDSMMSDFYGTSAAIKDLGSASDSAAGSMGDLASSIGKALGKIDLGSFGLSGPSGGGEGYALGGYTGAGGRLEPAGLVHRGEYVFSAPAVARIGLPALHAMHSGLPGYAAGGLVGGLPSVLPVRALVQAPKAPAEAPAAPAAMPVTIINETGHPIGQASTEVRNGPQGPRLEIRLRQAVLDVLGTADAAKRLGLNRMR